MTRARHFWVKHEPRVCNDDGGQRFRSQPFSAACRRQRAPLLLDCEFSQPPEAAMATTMRAGIASAEGIAIHDVPKPTPGEHEILVKVAAIGVDRADLGESKTKPDAPLTIPGLEWSGQVEQVGRA